MKLIRLVSYDNYKGEKNYLNNQRFYEICRTVLLFGISLAIYGIGYFTSGSNKNILSIIAVLGLLPASKSLVSVIMFIRYKSVPKDLADAFDVASKDMVRAFDRVFTSSSKNYFIDHLVVKEGKIYGCTRQNKFSEDDFEKHISAILKAENYKDIKIKIFTDKDKYLERLRELQNTENGNNDEAVVKVLCSVSL